MKTTARIVAVTMALLMVALMCTACGNILMGEYEAEEVDLIVAKYTITYKFSGNKVTATTKSVGSFSGNVTTKTYEGTYEIDDDVITFNWEEDDDVMKSESKSFEKTDDGIIIGKTEYKKK